VLDGRGKVLVRPAGVIEPVRILGSCTPGTISGTGTVDTPLARALITGEDLMTEWKPAMRAPDPAVRVLEERFQPYVLPLAKLERLATGCRWAEGPVWFGDHRTLVWSDIPNDRMLRWDAANETLSVFRQPSNYANGSTRDQQGRLVTCEHGGRQVTRTEHDGTITVLADGYQGKRLNAPNDVVVAADGAVWFSDPTFGILGDYEGYRAEPELPTYLYRLGPDGRLDAAAELRSPNGLAFSPDESVLYVVESRAVPHRRIVAYDVRDGSLGEQRTFIDCGDGIPDGLRIDEDGNLWCGWGGGEGLDGVRVFAPDATPIGHIDPPERCANLAFGGRARNRLFLAAHTSLYALYVNVRGVS
jgi:gluconolactonase